MSQHSLKKLIRCVKFLYSNKVPVVCLSGVVSGHCGVE